MNRLPWFMFYPADWIKETRELSLLEKGLWIDLLSYMWESKSRGSLTTTWEGLARMVGARWGEIEVVVLGMSRRGIVNLTDANGNITLTCRRMERNENKRESNRLRQRKFYNAKSNADLTDKKTEDRRHKRKEELLIPEDLLESEAEIRDWLEYKKQRGESYKPKGLTALFGLIRLIPKEERRAAVDHSMGCSYAGLFRKNGDKPREVKPSWDQMPSKIS